MSLESNIERNQLTVGKYNLYWSRVDSSLYELVVTREGKLFERELYEKESLDGRIKDYKEADQNSE